MVADGELPDSPGRGHRSLAEASGPDLFEASHSCLEAAGVPVPRVFCLDRSRRHFPADVAFVEDIAGGSLA